MRAPRTGGGAEGTVGCTTVEYPHTGRADERRGRLYYSRVPARVCRAVRAPTRAKPRARIGFWARAGGRAHARRTPIAYLPIEELCGVGLCGLERFVLSFAAVRLDGSVGCVKPRGRRCGALSCRRKTPKDSARVKRESPKGSTFGTPRPRSAAHARVAALGSKADSCAQPLRGARACARRAHARARECSASARASGRAALWCAARLRPQGYSEYSRYPEYNPGVSTRATVCSVLRLGPQARARLRGCSERSTMGYSAVLTGSAVYVQGRQRQRRIGSDR